MTEQLRKMGSHWVLALGMMLVALLSGCETAQFGDMPAQSGNVFHVGDRVSIKFLGVTGAEILPEHNERVHDDGTITLSLIGSVAAAGKTTGDLQKEIHDRYVASKYFPELTVTVFGEATFFYVLGDVVSAGQKEYPGNMTVVKAIAAAGGFTEFAKRTNVRLTHAGKTKIVNVEKALQDDHYDAPVYPGDRIFVKRKIL